MAEQKLYTLKGWRWQREHSTTVDSLQAALWTAYYTLDDNSWMVCEIYDPDGKLIMERDEIVDRALALPSQKADAS